MTTGAVDPLVTDYLARLAAAAAELPPDRRAELLAEIGEHIDAARVAGAAGDEAAVRTLLDRLGEPAEIVAAATEDGPAGPAGSAAAPPHRPGPRLELAAVLMLTIGSLIPVLGWLVGVLLLWSSRRWRRGEKLLGTLVVPGGPGLLLLLAGLPTQSCGGGSGSPGGPDGSIVTTPETCTGFSLPPAIGVALAVFIFVAPLIVAAVLWSRARDRPNWQ
ncbi:MAG: hypothetical protein V7637_2862 [Mycobacteriales bacterium]|jgi:hypothetical protein